MRWERVCWLHDVIGPRRPIFQNQGFIKWPSFCYHLVQTKWKKKLVRKLHFVLFRRDNTYLNKFDDKINLV